MRPPLTRKMLNVLLFAIFVALLLVARELWLLRAAKQLTQPTLPQKPYKPKVFTFARTGWDRVLNRWLASLAVLISMFVWWEFVSAFLHQRLKLKSNPAWLVGVDLLGITVLCFACYPLFLIALKSMMDAHDQRVLRRELSAQEREYLDRLWARFESSDDYEHAELEYDRVCRAHFL